MVNRTREIKFSKSTKTASGIVGLASALVLLAAPITSIAGSFQLDGIKTGADAYTESFSSGWYDGHGQDKSAYKISGSQQTTVHYGKGTDAAGDATEYSWLFLEVPLYAKNMIWGKDIFTAQDKADYGDKDFDFSGATGSEKVKFGAKDGDPDKFGIELDLAGDFKDESIFTVVGFRDSVDWLLGAGSAECGSDPDAPTKNCEARNRTMSFEVKLAALDDAGFNALKSAIQTSKLEFHLSPERIAAVSQVPLPAAFWLFGSALIGFIGFSRRTNLG